MKTTLITLLWTLLGLSAAAREIPLLANVRARPHTSLDGRWQYIVDPLENGYYGYRMEELKNGFFRNRKAASAAELVEYDFDTADRMQIPSDWNTRDERLFFYEGTIWFKRDFKVSKRPGKRYVLYFGAVNYEAKVWVNGQKAGEHVGGYTPFNFDVTDLLRDGANFVVVKADNKRHAEAVPTLNMDWWNYGGITRSVVLAELPGTYVEQYGVQLAGRDRTRIAASVRLNRPEAGCEVRIRIPELGIDRKLVTDQAGCAATELKARPALWSPEDPVLYDVQIACGEECIDDRIGFRTIETRGKQILLNGEPVFLRGVSLHEEAPYGQGRAHSREHAATLLGWAKEMGCNYVRLAHYPHNEQMVREAERLGLMVWSEIPVYWTIAWENPATYHNAERQLREMIARDRNRCNIVIWSVANETPHGEARDRFLTALADTARALDPTRLVSMAMEVTEAPNNVNRLSDNMHAAVDIVSFNQYCGWYRGTNEQCRQMTWVVPYDKPVIVSEFGGGALQGLHGAPTERWTEEFQEELYRRNLEMLDRIDGLAGLSPWVLVDFRSARRQLPRIQDFYNRKGLVSSDGIRKKAFFVMQDYYRHKQEQYAPGRKKNNLKR